MKLKLLKNIKLSPRTISIILIMGILSISLISAMDITFFYSEDCPHCQKIKPLIFDLATRGYKGHWDLYEINNEYNYPAFIEEGFTGVPAFKIKTSDNRIVKFTGADMKKLDCELQEMTTKECSTYSADHCIKESWFKW